MANKGTFSWSQLWSYYSSENYTDDLRKDTLSGMELPKMLEGATPEVQVEILADAPEEILVDEVLRVLHPRARVKLKIPTTEADVYNFVHRNWSTIKT